MDGDRVGSLIESLTSTYEAAFNFYTKWKQKQEDDNHYYRGADKRSPVVSKCGLGTSLDLSSYRIKSTYQVGFAIIGPEFFVGDTICRDCLWENLTKLHERVSLLRLAILSPRREPLDLHELIQVSEATRHNCVDALVQQYRRLAVGRLVPPDLPIPNLKPSLKQYKAQPSRPAKVPQSHDRGPSIEFDRQTAVWSTTSDPPVFQSEPPSPPPTPQYGDTQPSLPVSGPTLRNPPSSQRTARRPNNSVFSIFCPEAMALQVDPARSVPSTVQHCVCGYEWHAAVAGSLAGEDGEAVPLKDGFRLTERFLAKSHCEQKDGREPGYGCVLCTSSGRAETFDGVEALRAHVDAVHTKWQMLHDRDMA